MAEVRREQLWGGDLFEHSFGLHEVVAGIFALSKVFWLTSMNIPSQIDDLFVVRMVLDRYFGEHHGGLFSSWLNHNLLWRPYTWKHRHQDTVASSAHVDVN